MKIYLTQDAEKNITLLDESERKSLISSLKNFEHSETSTLHKSMKMTSGSFLSNLEDVYQVRLGDWRIVYTLNKEENGIKSAVVLWAEKDGHIDVRKDLSRIANNVITEVSSSASSVRPSDTIVTTDEN